MARLKCQHCERRFASPDALTRHLTAARREFRKARLRRRLTKARNRGRTNATPDFAIQIKDDTELGLAVLIAEFGDSSYEPIAVVATVSEAREIAAGDLRTRMQEMEMGCEDVQPPESYTLWAAGLAGVYHPIKISLAEL
jgi:hypothetical protein